MQEPLKSKLYKDIQEETDLYISEINQIIQFMFGEVKRTMEEGNLQQVDLQYLGSFKVKPGRSYKLKDRKPKKKDDRII